MRHPLALLILLILLSLAPPAQARPYTAKVYEIGSNRSKLLFNLKRTEKDLGNAKLEAKVVFTDVATNKEAVTEDVLYERERPVKYVLKKPQINEEGQLEIKDGKLLFSYTAEGKTKTDDEDDVPNLIMGPYVVEYLTKHWDTLVKGDEVKTRFAALDRKETVGFTFKRIDQEKNPEQVVIRMKPSSFIIAAMVHPLIFTFDKASKKLHTVVGRTLPKRRVDDKWKDLEAEIVYD
jgi:hypothetical protein